MCTAVGPIGLVAQQGCAAHLRTEVGQHTAQRIGHKKARRAAIGFADQVPAQAIVVFAELQRAGPIVGMFLHAERIERDFGVARARAGGRPLQDAVARGIVHVPFLVGGGLRVVPAHQVIQPIIAEGIGEQGAAVGDRAAGDIAPGVVATAIDLPALGGAGGAGAIEAGQLVGLTAATVEVLLLGAAPVERPLPQLAQVRVDVRIAVAGPRQAVARSTATGAIACCRGCSGVARPHQPVLLVVAERFGLAAPRIGGVRHGCLRGGQTGDVARRVVGTRLAEDRAAGAAVGPPGGRRAGGAQIGVVLELLGGQRPARTRLEVDGVELCARVIDQRRQVGRGTGVVAQPRECSRAVVRQRGGIALPGWNRAGGGF